MINQLVSNDFLISVVMALVIAVLGFPFIIAILLFFIKYYKRNEAIKK